MDEFDRGIIAYVGFTASMWFVSWGMYMNGDAFPENATWVFIVLIRNIFTALGIMYFIASEIVAHHKEQERQERERAEEGREKLKREELERKSVIWQIEEEQRQKEHEARSKKEKEEKIRQQEELRKNETIKRQTRSAEEAAEDVLNSFL